jgi:4-hydroxybenzoyl-CoA thioesterase
MNLKPTMLGSFKRKSERRKFLLGSEPDEAAFTHIHIRIEDTGMAVSQLAIDAVGRNDQIGVAISVLGLDLELKGLLNAKLGGALLQNVQQLLAADAAKSMTTGTHHRAAKMHVDIVPVIKTGGDGVMRLRVGVAKPLHGLVGKHHAPTEGIARPIALDDLDPCPWQVLLELNGGIQTRRAAAKADDSSHCDLPQPRFVIYLDIINVKYIAQHAAHGLGYYCSDTLQELQIMAAFQREIPVRFGHCDPATFVFYPRYFEMINSFVEDWFEDGLEASFPGLMHHKGIVAPTVHFTIDFPNPSKFGDRLTFKLEVEKIGRSSCELAIEASCQGKLRLQARQILVFMDCVKRTALPIPVDVAKRLQRFKA